MFCGRYLLVTSDVKAVVIILLNVIFYMFVHPSDQYNDTIVAINPVWQILPKSEIKHNDNQKKIRLLLGLV